MLRQLKCPICGHGIAANFGETPIRIVACPKLDAGGLTHYVYVPKVGDPIGFGEQEVVAALEFGITADGTKTGVAMGEPAPGDAKPEMLTVGILLQKLVAFACKFEDTLGMPVGYMTSDTSVKVAAQAEQVSTEAITLFVIR